MHDGNYLIIFLFFGLPIIGTLATVIVQRFGADSGTAKFLIILICIATMALFWRAMQNGKKRK